MEMAAQHLYAFSMRTQEDDKRDAMIANELQRLYEQLQQKLAQVKQDKKTRAMAEAEAKKARALAEAESKEKTDREQSRKLMGGLRLQPARVCSVW
jgi:hypothetical protein